MLGQVRKVAIAGDSSNDVDSHDKPLLESEIRERTDQLLLAVAEVDYQENLIRERQEGINIIHRDVNTIHNLFLDVASHVSAQGESLDHIESNVTNARDQTSQANEQLSVASRRAPSRRKTCLQFLLLVLLFFVMAGMFKSLFHGSSNEGLRRYNLHI
jgi:t-SNARE complex subunit (syntaxin)